MGITDLSDAAREILVRLLDGSLALYRTRTQFSSDVQFFIGLFGPQREPYPQVIYPVNADEFRRLWRGGYLYRVGKGFEIGGEVSCYLLSGTGHIAGEICKNPSAKKTPKGKKLPNALKTLAQGYELHIVEVNRPHNIWEWNSHLKGKTLRRTVVLSFLQQQWVEPVGYPSNPDGNLKAWHWVYRISPTGRTAFAQMEHLGISGGKYGSELEADSFRALVEELTERIVDEIGIEQPLAQRKRFFDQLFREVREEYLRTQLSVEQAAAERHAGSTQAWAVRHGYVTRDVARKRLELTEQSFDIAEKLGIVRSVDAPVYLEQEISNHYRGKYYDVASINLSEDERARILHETLLTRSEAAQRLAITPQEFDRLRKTFGIQRAGSYASRANGHGYFYRLSDIESLTQQTAYADGARNW